MYLGCWQIFIFRRETEHRFFLSLVLNFPEIYSFLKILSLDSFGKLVRQIVHSISGDNGIAPFHL